MKALLDRVYTQSMDGRTNTCSLLYDILYLLHDPPAERIKGAQKPLRTTLDGSGTFVVSGTHTKEHSRQTKHSTRKKSRETWDLSNIFRHEIKVEWTTDASALTASGTERTATTTGSTHTSTTPATTAALMMHRTTRHVDHKKGCLLPDGCFRFWHVIDVATLLDLHDEIVRQESNESNDGKRVMQSAVENQPEKKQKGETRKIEQEVGFREKAAREVLQEEQEEQELARAAAMAAMAAAAAAAAAAASNVLENSKSSEEQEATDKKTTKGITKKSRTTDDDDNNNDANRSSTFFCGGREEIVERITADEPLLSHIRIRGQGDLGHAMRELLQLEAYESVHTTSRNSDNNSVGSNSGSGDRGGRGGRGGGEKSGSSGSSGSSGGSSRGSSRGSSAMFLSPLQRPLFKLSMRPDVLCLRLEWPSTNLLRTARITDAGRTFVW